MIERRRSVRAYRAERIAPDMLAELKDYMEGLKPLIPGGRVEGRIIPTEHASLLQRWQTPHFVAIFSEPTDEGLINAGFMFQQFDLYAQRRGLGTCWVGLGSLTEAEPVPAGMKLAVLMALGIPDQVPLRAGAGDFKRKPLAEIADVPDARLEPLRLAPSATNSQPWFVTHEGDALHIWREELGLIRQRTHGRMNKIDIGIGLCHLYVSDPAHFRFRRLPQPPQLPGYLYIGTVEP